MANSSLKSPGDLTDEELAAELQQLETATTSPPQVMPNSMAGKADGSLRPTVSTDISAQAIPKAHKSWPEKVGETTLAAGMSLADSGSWGTIRPLMAAIRSVGGDKDYQGNLNDVNQAFGDARRQYPVPSLVGGGIGALKSFGLARGAMGPGASALGKLGRSTATGAAQGAAMGANTSQAPAGSGDWLADAVRGGGIGGGMTALMGGAGMLAGRGAQAMGLARPPASANPQVTVQNAYNQGPMRPPPPAVSPTMTSSTASLPQTPGSWSPSGVQGPPGPGATMNGAPINVTPPLSTGQPMQSSMTGASMGPGSISSSTGQVPNMGGVGGINPTTLQGAFEAIKALSKGGIMGQGLSLGVGGAAAGFTPGTFGTKAKVGFATAVLTNPAIAPQLKSSLAQKLSGGASADLGAAIHTLMQQSSAARKQWKEQQGADQKSSAQPTYSNSSSGIDAGM